MLKYKIFYVKNFLFELMDILHLPVYTSTILQVVLNNLQNCSARDHPVSAAHHTFQAVCL